MAGTVKMLTQTQTHEVSLVRRGANRKVFAVTKSESFMDPLKAVLSTPAEGEEQFVAALKSAGADQARIDASVAIYRIQKGFADKLKTEDHVAIAKSAGLELAAKAKKADDEEDEDEEDDEDMPAFLKKKKAKKSAEALALEGVSPEAAAKIEAAFTAKSAEVTELTETVKSLSGMVKTLVEKSDTQQYVAKAARDFAHVPGTPDEIGAVLKSAEKAGVGDVIGKLLGTVNTLVQKSALFGNVGTAGAAGTSGDAWSKIEKLATGLTMKSESGAEMSQAQKISYVMKSTAEGRELYRQYLADNPAQRAKHNFA